MNDSSLIKFLWSILLQLNAAIESVGAANINLGPRMQGFPYLHGRITGSLEIGTLIQSIADFSPRCIIKQLEHIPMQYIQRFNTFEDVITSNDQLQWVIFHIHILKSKGYNPSFEVSKVASNFHVITATIQTIEYWIRRTQVICLMLKMSQVQCLVSKPLS